MTVFLNKSFKLLSSYVRFLIENKLVRPYCLVKTAFPEAVLLNTALIYYYLN